MPCRTDTRVSGGAALVFLLSIFSPLAGATTYATYNLNSNGVLAWNTIENSSEWIMRSGTTGLTGWITEGYSGTADIAAYADYGVSKLSLNGTGKGYSADVYAGWRDSLIVDNIGGTGWIYFNLSLDATLVNSIYGWSPSENDGPLDSLPPGNSSTAFVDVNWGSGSRYQYASFGIESRQTCDLNGVCENPVDKQTSYTYGATREARLSLNGYTGTFGFYAIQGEQYSIDIALNAAVRGRYGSSNVDALHSLTWGGIQEVTDDNGNSVPYEIMSATGFDYRTPYIAAVPEPSTYALFLLGLVAIGVASRRRKHESTDLHSCFS